MLVLDFDSAHHRAIAEACAHICDGEVAVVVLREPLEQSDTG